MAQNQAKCVSFIILSLFVCGCATRTSLRQSTNAGKSAYEPVKPASLSQYIRAIYTLSAENSAKQAEQRAALLSQAPQLAELVAHVEKDPTDRDATSRLVAAYMDHQLYWAAYELLTNALAASPDDSTINMDLARIWDVWGEYELALQHGQRAIANGPTPARAYEVLGRIHLHRKAPAEAIVWYSRALQEGGNASVLANLGYAHMLLSEWENARASLEKAIDRDNTIPEAHNNLAIVLSKLGDETGALGQLSKTSQPSVAFNNMGVLYLQEKKIDRALYFFEESLRLDPGYEIAQRNFKAVQALTPPPSIIHLPAFGDQVSTADAGLTPNCPVIAEPTPPLLLADTAPHITSEIDLSASSGIVETDVLSQLEQDRPNLDSADGPAQPTSNTIAKSLNSELAVAPGNEPSQNLLVAGESLDANSSSAEERPITGGRSALAAESKSAAACIPSMAVGSEHRPATFSFKFNDRRLGMAGIVGLLLGVGALLMRSQRSGRQAAGLQLRK